MKRFLWLGFVVCVYLICTGCGDTFRPIIIPNPPVFPNPRAAHTVLSINDNAPPSGQVEVVPGSAMVIDVSGDTVESVKDVGLAPVHAVQQTATQVLVVNHAVPGTNPNCAQNPVNVCASLTKLTFSNLVIASAETITLPPNSAPNFVAVAPTATTAYVTLPTYVDPTTSAIIPSVGVVSTLSNQLQNVVPVGKNPDAIAVTPDNTKVYVANQGDSTVNGFTVTNTNGLTARTINGSFSAPVWVIARSDNQRVYVLGNGVVSTIDTTSTAGPDSVIDASVNVPGAAYMLYDGNLNRLYIPWGGQLTMLDVSQSIPVVLAGGPLPITPVLSSARPQGDVCSAFNPSVVTAAAAASLPDGSRAYVGSYAEFAVNVNISDATPNTDGIHTTYTYSLQPPGSLDLLPGMVITISGVTSKLTNPSAFNGTFTVLSVGGGTFQVTNSPSPTDTYVSGGTGAAQNICPQVTVINTVSNTVITPSIAVPGFPAYDAFCSTTRFRFTMAAGGDSSRVYLASCDGGMVNIIDTSTDTYFLNQPAPIGVRPPIPPSPLNPSQNPVFLIAGP
jgi:DNA-binding beta-propeller fold protein YncE